MRTTSSSTVANTHLARLEALQATFVAALTRVSAEAGHPVEFEPVEWLRDEGRHGGGVRYVTRDTPVFDRASLNISHVHYDDLPDKALASASALSCIIHPRNPHAPSIHLHASWTELRNKPGYWRVMADLNPGIPHPEDKAEFDAALKGGSMTEHGRAQGEKYFWIPALERHRGVSHFYLEQFRTDAPAADADFAVRFETGVIEAYTKILARGNARPFTDADVEKQLAYHTLYLFQVLTLDRGTTSGLLVHAQNDLGIMGSLPSHVDRLLLRSWGAKVPEIQKPLVEALVAALPDGRAVKVSDCVKPHLADAVREFYRAHPEALALQARGDVVPPTVANHGSAD